MTKIELNLFSMTYHAIHDLLKHSFPKSNKEIWASAASKEIQGKNPFEVLAWQSEDQITFFPYYDKQDAEKFYYLKNFQTEPSKIVNEGSRLWKNLPFISVHDFQIANDIALNHLQNGADGILFDIRKFKVVDINRLLNEINWTYCNVSFLVTSSSHICDNITEFIRKKNYEKTFLEGTLFWETVPHIDHTVLKSLSDFENFHALGIYLPSSTPVDEISNALQKIVSIMDMLTDKGYDKKHVWRNISVSCPTGLNFFLEIAKLKALRFLLYQLANAFEIPDYQYMDFKIHSRSEHSSNEKFQPHGNVLKGTYAALSAVSGGCDSLTILTEDENNMMLNRIVRNISNILREESHMDKVSDPIAGSDTVNSLVHQIAQVAWADFQKKITTS